MGFGLFFWIFERVNLGLGWLADLMGWPVIIMCLGVQIRVEGTRAPGRAHLARPPPHLCAHRA